VGLYEKVPVDVQESQVLQRRSKNLPSRKDAKIAKENKEE